MLFSMTGFASREAAIPGWSWTTELRGVNGKSLDLRLRLPDIDGLEANCRKQLQAKLGRGNVTLSVKLQRDEGAATATLKPEVLSSTLELLGEIEATAASKGVKLAKCRATDIASVKGVLDFSDDGGDKTAEPLRRAILESFEDTLTDFIDARKQEGESLYSVLSAQIDRIEELITAASKSADERDEAQRASIKRALSKLLSTGDMPDENRLVQELALIAVKTDVTEELDRLHAHIRSARELLVTDGPVGRKLDFLMQEFNREANTLCSKSQSSALTSIGLDLKTVIDQMREQVQNIE